MTSHTTAREIQEELRRLELEMVRSRGWRYYLEIRRLRISYAILNGNWAELRRRMDNLSLKDVPPGLWNARRAEPDEAALSRVIGAFQNYVASGTALQNQMNQFARRMYSPAQEKTYQDELERRWMSLEAYRALTIIRDVVAHVSLPNHSIHATWTLDKRHPVIVEVRLDLQALKTHLTRSGKRVDDRKLLETLGEPTLRDLAEPYAAGINDFFAWLLRWHEVDVFVDDLKYLDEITHKQQILQSQLVSLVRTLHTNR